MNLCNSEYISDWWIVLNVGKSFLGTIKYGQTWQRILALQESLYIIGNLLE